MISRKQNRLTGQALVEYALILALIVIGLVTVIAAVGPSIGNVFSNTVVNILDAPEPRASLMPEEFWNTVTAVWLYTPEGHSFATWTPAPATYTPSPAPTDVPLPTDEPPTDTPEPTPGPSLTPTEAVFPVPWEDDIEALNARDFFIPDEATDCGWAVTSEHFHSAANAWSDSPSLNYVDGSNCILELRGVLDLTAAVAPVELSFWDRWHLSAYDRAYVEISTNDGGSWINLTTEDNGSLHYNSYNLTFNQEIVDLSDYASDGTNPGQQIRLRFRLDATSNLSVGDGWYIDDIRVEQSITQDYPFPFNDPVEAGIGDCPEQDCWVPSGTWARSGEAVHTGSYAWSDSPGQNYVNGSNTTLTLNGEITIPSDAANPKLVFWNRWDLRAIDHAYVEISSESNPNWTIVHDHFNNTNLSWSRTVVDLAAYKGEAIRIRFRVDALSHSAVGNGWWIDDISIDSIDVPVIDSLPWLDDMEGTSVWWIPEGTWAISSGQSNSGSAAWSDSPGQNYVHGSNAILNLNAVVDLASAGAINPELVFWDRYDLNIYDTAYVEISTDNGSSWQPNAIHSNEQNLSWAKNVIDLTSYASNQILIRFRLDARNNAAVGDGWWIDDVELREKPAEKLVTLPWCEDFEPGQSGACDQDLAAYWEGGGTWDVSAEAPPASSTCHSGSNCWSDSPGANTQHGTNASLTLNAKIDLTSGPSNPVLFYWQAYHLRAYDYGYVEVSTDGGSTWKEADTSHSTDSISYSAGASFAWTRNQVSLSSYIGQQIMLRFRLDARDGASVGDGWWIDDIRVEDYTPHVYTLPFIDPAEPGYASNWIMEGTWAWSTENPCDKEGCEPSTGTYTDSPGENYKHNTNTSMILDGVIELPSGSNPRLTFWRYRDVEQGNDYLAFDISTDGGYSWSSCYRYANVDSSWSSYSCDLTGYAGKSIGLRIRLESLINSTTDQGVWIDRMELAD
jgi:Flp pilus assembly pilin Flp